MLTKFEKDILQEFARLIDFDPLLVVFAQWLVNGPMSFLTVGTAVPRARRFAFLFYQTTAAFTTLSGYFMTKRTMILPFGGLSLEIGGRNVGVSQSHVEAIDSHKRYVTFQNDIQSFQPFNIGVQGKKK